MRPKGMALARCAMKQWRGVFWATAAPGSNADSSLAKPGQVVQYRRD